MSSSVSVRSFSVSRQPSFTSRSLMDISRGRPRASVSFAAAAASPLGRSASVSQDLNGPLSLQLSSADANRANNKEAMQSLNNRLANYLDKVGHVTSRGQLTRAAGGNSSSSSSSFVLQVRTLERSNADLELKIKQQMMERIPKAHDLDSMMAQAHAVEQEVAPR